MENLERLREWLDTTPYEGIIISRRDNFKWLTQGIENAVVANTEIGVCLLVIKKDGTIDLIADSSDCPCMEQEKNVLHAKCILVPWYETIDTILKKYCKGKAYASDTGLLHTVCVQDELIPLRMLLNEVELRRYRKLGQECAAIVETAVKEAEPGQTEKEVAERIKMDCIRYGISPDCVLVGSDERILNYRHPMPEDKRISHSLMAVLGGEKYGLNVSLTRMVYFGDIPQYIRKRMQKTQFIFACMQNMMQDQMKYQDYWEQLKRIYKEAGYPDEWKLHHQGGPTGYGCREFILTPFTPGYLKEGQAYAWNPTIQGTKCEETTCLFNRKVEILTRTKEWPCTLIHTPYGNLDVAGILRK